MDYVTKITRIVAKATPENAHEIINGEFYELEKQFVLESRGEDADKLEHDKTLAVIEKANDLLCAIADL